MRRFGFDLSALWETVMGVLPLTAILVFCQLALLRKPIEHVKEFSIGIILSILGLHFFLKGVSMSFFPLADSVGGNLVLLNRKWLIIIVAFVIGYFGTLVEPALRALAMQVEEVSSGAIPHKVLIHAVGIGFGLGMGIGIFKILHDVPYIKILAPLLIIVLILAFITPKEFASIAMDAASATTGPVNIPLNMALAIGLTKQIEGADPLIAGFGIIGLTSIGAMVSVLILGILTRL